MELLLSRLKTVLLAERPNIRRRLLFTAVIVAPFIILAVLVAVFAVNVPFWDQWELVPLLQKHDNGTLGFADFFAQHNEHRLLFPRLIMVGLALATHWNTIYECFVSLALAAVGFVCLYQLLRPVLKAKWLLVGVAMLVSMIIFSPVQLENWLWGWQLQWYLTTLGLIGAVWALHAWRADRMWKIALAAVGATVATYSLASGFMVWIVCLPLVLLQKRLRSLTWVWILLGIGATAAYFIGYQDPPYQPSKHLFLHEPLQFIAYMVTYLGRSVTPVVSLSLPIGVALIAGAVGCIWFVYKRSPALLTGRLLPWLCLAAYSVLATVSTAVSRLGYGMEQAFSGRYVTLSQFFLLGVVVMLAVLFEDRLHNRISARRGWRLILAGLGCIVLLVGVTYVYGAAQMRVRSHTLGTMAQCLRTAQGQDDACLLQSYPNKTVIWERLQYLRHMRYGGL